VALLEEETPPHYNACCVSPCDPHAMVGLCGVLTSKKAFIRCGPLRIMG
jgi:hypothetical protein